MIAIIVHVTLWILQRAYQHIHTIHTATICRKLEEQEKAASKPDSGEGIDDQTEGMGADKAEENQDDAKPDTAKKPSVSRGESKQSHTSQDTGKKTDSKKTGTAPNKDSMVQVVPDLEEEELCRDCAMIAVSMGTAVTGAKIKGAALYEHLAKVSGKEVFWFYQLSDRSSFTAVYLNLKWRGAGGQKPGSNRGGKSM